MGTRRGLAHMSPPPLRVSKSQPVNHLASKDCPESSREQGAVTRGLGRDLLRDGDTSLLVVDVGRGLFIAFLKVPPNTRHTAPRTPAHPWPALTPRPATCQPRAERKSPCRRLGILVPTSPPNDPQVS